MPQSYATAQKLLPLLLDSLEDYALFMMDTRGHILTWTRGVLRVLGYEEAEFVGQEAALIFTPQDRENSVFELELGRASENGRSEDVRWHIRKDGSLFWANGQMIALRDEAGELRGFAKFLRDDTKRKKHEEALQQAHQQSETANRIKDEFLATLSHELRSPLNAISGWANILRTQDLDRQAQKQGLETIERNAHSQSQLIEDLLDVSRILTGKMHLDLRPVELADITTDAVNGILPTAQAKRIEVKTDIDHSTGFISGDVDRLAQVLRNLLSNAVKFTPKNGTVFVSMARVDSQVEVQVKDTGKGISPEFLPHVFERFRQADSTSTRAHGGLGLGLALVRELVEGHGGTVRAHSDGEGRGATFTLSFPLLAVRFPAQSPQSQNADDEDSLSLPSLEGLRVLVVDDERDIQEMVRFILQGRGAIVEVVGDAQAAFGQIVQSQEQKEPFDVLLSDIGLPQEDGYSLVRRIRAHERSSGGFLPAIACTAYADQKSRMNVLRAGFQVHLTKPVDLEELVVSVASLKGRAQFSREKATRRPM